MAVILSHPAPAAGKHHRPRARSHGHHIISRFDGCVGNREKGEPGDLSLNTIHWHADADGYEGAYSWLNSTWLAQGGGVYAQHAYEASPREQSRIFDRWSQLDPGAWPNTIPPCLYLRR